MNIIFRLKIGLCINYNKTIEDSHIKMIKIPPQIMTSYDRIANERPVYTVIDQW